MSLSDDTRADRELNDLGAGTISAAKLEFFFDVLRGEYDTVGHKIGMAYNAIAIPSDAPLARPQSPHSEHLSRRLQQPAIDDSEAAEPLTEEIKRAVTSAQAKYAEWSLDSSLYPHRGPNGFFSWARHGAYGQTRAKKFMEIITTMDEEANITAAINGYLLDDKTRYHRHSFASFLLDELKAIKRLPYLNLAYAPSSNLYDKNVVIAGLVSSEGLCQTGQMPHQC